jgi:hypothetical protein
LPCYRQHGSPSSALLRKPWGGSAFKRLKQENAELHRTNEILKAASAFFPAELDRPKPAFVRFITGRNGVFRIEPISRTLTKHGCLIAPAIYHNAAGRPPLVRARRDELLKATITRVYSDNFGIYGAWKGLAGAEPGASWWPGARWSG